MFMCVHLFTVYISDYILRFPNELKKKGSNEMIRVQDDIKTKATVTHVIESAKPNVRIVITIIVY